MIPVAARSATTCNFAEPVEQERRSEQSERLSCVESHKIPLENLVYFRREYEFSCYNHL
jgi:hypothetical protein